MTVRPKPDVMVPAVANATAILRYLSDHSEPIGVNVIARELALSPSSCFALLKTLVSVGFVDFDTETKKYELGPGAVRLARRALDPENAFEVSRSLMGALADRHHATSALWRVLRDERLLMIGHTGTRDTVQLHLPIGLRLPILIGAAGRSVAAAGDFDRARIEAMFAALKWENPPVLEDYLHEVEIARGQGWALDDGHYLRGVTSVGAAVRDESGEPRFSLTVAMLGGPLDPARLEALGQDVLATANKIAGRLFGA